MVTNATYTRMADHRYNLRMGVSQNYRLMSNLKIPRISRTQPQDKLYPVEVVERNGSQVRIHYVGYANSTDEWREQTDLVPTNSSTNGDNSSSSISKTVIQPYSLYNELGIKIKQSLLCVRKHSDRLL